MRARQILVPVGRIRTQHLGLTGRPHPETLEDLDRGRLPVPVRTEQRHGWLLDVPLGRPVIGPNIVGRYEYELVIVDGLGLDDLEMNAVIELIQEHVAGTARRARERSTDATASGMTDDEWWHAVLPTLTG